MADEGKENDDQDSGKNVIDKLESDEKINIEDKLKGTDFSQGSSYEDSITNATKTILMSITMVFCLLFDDNYKSDYQVSLEKIMQMKKFEHSEKNVSHIFNFYQMYFIIQLYNLLNVGSVTGKNIIAVQLSTSTDRLFLLCTPVLGMTQDTTKASYTYQNLIV